MKLRPRTIINNLIAGLLPLLFLFLVLVVMHKRDELQNIRRDMESYVNTFRIALEADLEKNRNYASFLNLQNVDITPQGRVMRTTRRELFVANRYKIRMYEVFWGSTNIYRDMYSWRDNLYAASDTVSAYIWDYLQKPQFTRNHTTTIPDLVSNRLVLRNVAIIYDLNNNRKAGYSEIVTPLDYDYFTEFAFQEFDLVYFVRSPVGVVFSHPDLDTAENRDILMQAPVRGTGPVPQMRLSDGRMYYMHMSPLIQIHQMLGSPQNGERPWAYIGILQDTSIRNKQYHQFLSTSHITIIVSVILLILISLWFANNLTRPLTRLEQDVARFDREMVPVEPPAAVVDEISSIQNSISDMSRHILENTRIIEQEKQELKHQQALILEYNEVIEQDRNKLRIQQDLMDMELDLARRIQMNLIPQKSPVDDIYLFYRPMEKLGGDFLQVYQLDQEQSLLFISDVSGHGVPAALVTTMLNSFIIQNLELSAHPAEFLHRMNTYLRAQSTENFVTALLGIYDRRQRSFLYALAGHNPPYVIRPDQVYCTWHPIRGLPLGILSREELIFMNKGYSEFSIQLEAGDHLLLTTDGVEEAVNQEAHSQSPGQRLEEFGDRMMTEALHAHFRQHKKTLIQSLVSSMQKFRGSEQFDDDICMIDLEIR